jgi:hypothetical protein
MNNQMLAVRGSQPAGEGVCHEGILHERHQPALPVLSPLCVEEDLNIFLPFSTHYERS